MDNFPFFPQSASTIGPHVDRLMLYVFAIAVFFAGLIAVLIVGFSVKYHYRRDADRSNPPAFNLPMELAWTGIPLVLVLSIFVWGARLFIQEHQPPPGAMDIYVVGKQWMWKLQHPEGPQEINALHVPVGRPVKLLMTSQDVIHSFFIPEFRVKQDVLPGRYSSEWFEVTRPGRYHLFCSQYCGTSHSGMTGWVTAMTPIDYARWLEEPQNQTVPGAAASASMAASGKILFQRLACITCHKSEGHGTGPSFVGRFGATARFTNGETALVDEAYLRDCILRPNRRVLQGYAPSMPSFQGQVSEEDLMQLIAYIKSL